MSSWWPGWLTWGKKPVKYMRSTDATRNPALRKHFLHYLDHTDPPATFRATDVAHRLTAEELSTMGYFSWTEVMPAVIELAFELREAGYCLILRKGKVVGDDVMAFEVEEDVKIRRVEE